MLSTLDSLRVSAPPRETFLLSCSFSQKKAGFHAEARRRGGRPQRNRRLNFG